MEESFKLNIDVVNAADAVSAATLAMRGIAQNPNQDYGNRGAINLQYQGKRFQLVRNAESYTIREV